MNIFYLDTNSVKAAQYMCNKHVIKQILESAQMLSTVHHLYPSEKFKCDCDIVYKLPEFLYKPTHQKHPCNKWIQKSLANYKWLAEHALALCHEYTYRYDKIHKSQEIIEWCNTTYPNIPDGPLTDPPQCMPPQYIQKNPVEGYRDYYWYNKRKNISMEWKRREKPDWWLEREK